MTNKLSFTFAILIVMLVFVIFVPKSQAASGDFNSGRRFSESNANFTIRNGGINDTSVAVMDRAMTNGLMAEVTDCVTTNGIDANCSIDYIESIGAIVHDRITNGSAYSVTDIWESEATKGISAPVLQRVSMALSSKSPRNITISISLTSTKKLKRIGIGVLRVQRSYKGNWLTVRTINNVVSYNTQKFYYSTTVSSLLSNSVYRVEATFIADVGIDCYRIYRTSGSIRCR